MVAFEHVEDFVERQLLRFHFHFGCIEGTRRLVTLRDDVGHGVIELTLLRTFITTGGNPNRDDHGEDGAE